MFYDINYKLRSIPINCKWLWIEGNKDTYFLINKLDIGAQDHCKIIDFINNIGFVPMKKIIKSSVNQELSTLNLAVMDIWH